MSGNSSSQNPRFRVLCGGKSHERDVSLRSGNAVYESLNKAVQADLIVLEEDALPAGLDPDADLLVPVIHGTYGEDGGLQAEMERRGFIYSGSDFSSSVVCFDKLYTKALAERVGIPTAKDLWVDNLVEGSQFDFPELGERYVCKPRRQGSSVGVFLAAKGEVISKEKILPDISYLIESYIEGIDLTVGVLDQEALGVVGIRPFHGFYDYENKYTSGRTVYDVPAEVSVDISDQLRKWSKKIYEICGCRDFARVDFRMSNSGELYFLEINTIPGLTETSLLPKSASILGYDFDELVLKMIEPSRKRFNKKVAI